VAEAGALAELVAEGWACCAQTGNAAAEASTKIAAWRGNAKRCEDAMDLPLCTPCGSRITETQELPGTERIDSLAFLECKADAKPAHRKRKNRILLIF
jgi:hypothetical protein